MLIWASDDEEDETAELMRELEKIKKERAEQREREVGLGLIKGCAQLIRLVAGARKGCQRSGATRARHRIG